MGAVGMEEIAMSCPCCGHDMTIWSSDCGYGEYYLSCDRSRGGCGYRSPIEQTRADAVDRHNRLARIVENYEAQKTEEPKPDTSAEKKTVEDIIGITKEGLAWEMFIYAESLFCSILENDWNEGNYKGEDVFSYNQAELRLRLVLEWIRRKDPKFDFALYSSDIVVHQHLGTAYNKLDHAALTAARAKNTWMPEADRAEIPEEVWREKMKNMSGKAEGFASI